MATAVVDAFDHKNKTLRGRVLLDTCASTNFITERFTKKLRLPLTKCTITIDALNEMSTTANHMCTVSFKSIHNEYSKTLRCLVVPSITDLVPSERILRERLTFPRNIPLADPQFHQPAPIDILIGSGPTLSLFSIGQINLSENGLDFYMQKTRLGWIFGGGLDLLSDSPKNIDNEKCMLSSAEIMFNLEKFWHVEEILESTNFSSEEIDCEEHFKQNVQRHNSGRYIVALPFKSNCKNLGQSREIAVQRLRSIQKKLLRNSELNKQYTAVMKEYQDLGHMSISNESVNSEGYFLPHHAVMKNSSNTTKVRVVFDGSAKTSTGVSLNQMLMVGPTIQDDLFTLLLRFRMYTYVITADIEKMYRQFLVRKEDRIFQKVLWGENETVAEYQLNTLTFGLAPSAFLAVRCLFQLADDECHDYPVGAQILKKDLYVDNLITGSNTITGAREICAQITNILKSACLNMRQWASNEPSILENIDEQNFDKDFLLDKDSPLKTLGIYWRSKSDLFLYTVKVNNTDNKVTKRSVLSEIAKIFDPLGLLGPVILFAKHFIQILWQRKLNWDESLPTDLHDRWVNFYSQLNLLDQISFDRRVLIPDSLDIAVIGFSDASERGYGACIYIRSIDANGKYMTNLLCSKSRVAPLKILTIPRLELCGALLLTKLYTQVISTLKITNSKTFLFTDSEIVLHWINTEPNLLKTFVSNRIAEIRQLTSPEIWFHVRSHDNPSDALSRGQNPVEFTRNPMWRHGPAWLERNEGSWPVKHFLRKSEPILELRKVQCLVSQTNIDILHNWSSFSKLKRVIFFILRMLPCRRRKTTRLAQREYAELVVVRLLQKNCFAREMNAITNNETHTGKGRLISLDPIVDKDGILRVGGRLQNANIPYDSKHPIILPTNNFITDLIIKHYHLRNYHSGIQTTLYAMRQKYWPLDARNQIRHVIKKCVQCFRAKPSMCEYIMGVLPRARVNRSRPFINVGVDYCGPFYIKEKKYRNRSKIKIYVAVFVCMAVKAVHLEVVSDLSSEAFINALKRFIARRGCPSAIFSDNGTNFLGAKNDLKELAALLNSAEIKQKLNDFSDANSIEFHFIPPAAPFFGGLWESAVKSFKHHLKRVAGNSLFTHENFFTLTTEIEAILNSRPLTPISNDPNDLLAFTPAHFLIGDSLISLPEQNVQRLPDNRLSARQLINKIKQHFWTRWSKEYLNELNVRQKWQTNKGRNLEQGELVLIQDDNKPSMQWRLGRVIECHPGKDDIVRTVTLKTASGELQRPVRKLAPLPINADNLTI